MAKSNDKVSLRPLTPPKGRKKNHCFVTNSRLVSGGNKNPAKQSDQHKAKGVGGGGALASTPYFCFTSTHITYVDDKQGSLLVLNIVKTFKSKCQKIKHNQTFQTTMKKKFKSSFSSHQAECQIKCKNVFRKTHVRKVTKKQKKQSKIVSFFKLKWIVLI